MTLRSPWRPRSNDADLPERWQTMRLGGFSAREAELQLPTGSE
jgi:hypothetical protein